MSRNVLKKCLVAKIRWFDSRGKTAYNIDQHKTERYMKVHIKPRLGFDDIEAIGCKSNKMVCKMTKLNNVVNHHVYDQLL